MTTKTPQIKRPGWQCPSFGAAASEHELIGLHHGHHGTGLRCLDLTGPLPALAASWVVHLNNTLPGTRASFVYWQDLAVSHFVWLFFLHIYINTKWCLFSACKWVCTGRRGGSAANSLPLQMKMGGGFETRLSGAMAAAAVVAPGRMLFSCKSRWTRHKCSWAASSSPRVLI